MEAGARAGRTAITYWLSLHLPGNALDDALFVLRLGYIDAWNILNSLMETQQPRCFELSYSCGKKVSHAHRRLRPTTQICLCPAMLLLEFHPRLEDVAPNTRGNVCGAFSVFRRYTPHDFALGIAHDARCPFELHLHILFKVDDLCSNILSFTS